MVDFVADLTAEIGAISAMTERAAAFLTDAGVDSRASHHVALVLDELLTNVTSYGGMPWAPISVRLKILPDQISGEVLDGGAMFDPRTHHVSTGADIDGPIGGLGLLLIHEVTMSLNYERLDGQNRTTFSIRRIQS